MDAVGKRENRKANLTEQQKDQDASPGGWLCKAEKTEVVEELNREHRFEFREHGAVHGAGKFESVTGA